MKYRRLGRTGLKVSEISLKLAYIRWLCGTRERGKRN